MASGGSHRSDALDLKKKTRMIAPAGGEKDRPTLGDGGKPAPAGPGGGFRPEKSCGPVTPCLKSWLSAILSSSGRFSATLCTILYAYAYLSWSGARGSNA